VILLGGGRAIVIDCGPGRSQQTVRLLRRYVDTIEALIISHNDADHDCSVGNVLCQYRKATKNIFFLQDRDATRLPRTFGMLQSAKEGDFPTPRRLEVDGSAPRVLFSENGVELSLLYPDLMANLRAQTESTGGPNQSSGVLRLRCGGRRVVFSGDATIEAWEYLAAQMPEEKPLPCDIMTVPHHGGMISRDPPKEQIHQTRLYSELIKPQYAVISVGTSNQHGHPRKEVVNALAKAGVTVICTQMTELCCDDLEAARFMRGTLTSPSRSTKQTSKTQSGRSKDVACFGSIVAEVSETHLQIANLNRYERDIAKVSGAEDFNPACRQ
jgi:competence protein ComEC